jgi:hypothetical protein
MPDQCLGLLEQAKATLEAMDQDQQKLMMQLAAELAKRGPEAVAGNYLVGALALRSLELTPDDIGEYAAGVASLFNEE